MTEMPSLFVLAAFKTSSMRRNSRRLALNRRVIYCLGICYAIACLNSAVVTEFLSSHSQLQAQMAGWSVAMDFVDGHKSSPSQQQTLALLYPPGMIGGFRNQVLRFVGFLGHARSNNITQLLLPTLLWSTQFEASGRFFPIPMDAVFDINLWNAHSEYLPRLVSNIEGSDCWSPIRQGEYFGFAANADVVDSNASRLPPLAGLVLEQSPFLTPLLNLSYDVATGQSNVKIRKLDLLPNVSHCRHPTVYGGGKGAGRLWNDYLRMSKVKPDQNSTTSRETTASSLMRWVAKALQPSERWRQVADECVAQQTTDQDVQKGIHPPYIAVHARVEVDMMVHRCGRHMEKNLTKILEMVDGFLDKTLDPSQQSGSRPGVFIAVSRSGMRESTTNADVQNLANENYATLVQRSLSGLGSGGHDRRPEGNRNATVHPPIFECGEIWMQHWYSQNNVQSDFFGSLVPSVINFYLATHAAFFVGVASSSWSTDVWTARFYQGKGDDNYEYTPNDGIRKLGNGGLPPPHKNCK